MIKFAVLGRAAALAIVMSGAVSVSAQAQEIPEAHMAAARDAIASLNVTDRFDNILPNMAEALKGQFIQSSPNFQEQINAIVDQEALALAPRRADLEKEAATIYAKSFSVDELKTISTFFTTEAGKTTVRKVADGTVEMVEIKTGIQDGAYIQVTEGLNDGDKVVAKAGVFVRDGDRINPVEETSSVSN